MSRIPLRPVVEPGIPRDALRRAVAEVRGARYNERRVRLEWELELLADWCRVLGPHSPQLPEARAVQQELARELRRVKRALGER